MESIKEINEEINTITSLIAEKHPELLDFLNEMPVTVPDLKHPQINLKVLLAYYYSILGLKEKYLEQLLIKKQQHDKIQRVIFICLFINSFWRDNYWHDSYTLFFLE